MVTKRGTNSFHGSLYEYYLGSNCRSQFLVEQPHSGSSQGPSLHTAALKSSEPLRHSLGGPLLPNFLGGKTYFFVNYEGRRFPQGTTIEKLVPTPSLRAGIITLPT